jgi:hypothetical protein
MNDVALVAIMLAFFALSVGLVHVLGRMIDKEADPDIGEDIEPDGLSESMTHPGRQA